MLNLSTRLQYDSVDKTKKNNNHLLVQIEAPKLDSVDRPNVRLVLVLDVSTSMRLPAESGQNYRTSKLDVVKQISKKLIGFLGESDEVAIVTYGSHVSVISPNVSCKNKSHLNSLIDSISTRGCTNLSGGLSMGYDQISGDFDGVTRVLLLTDGQANEGIKDHDGLVELAKQVPEGCVLSTLGFGLGAEEELLANMALAGGGNYHFISNIDQANQAFAAEVGGAAAVVAQNIGLEIKPAKNVKILEVLNDFDVTDVDGIAVINVGDIYAQEKKNVLIKFETPIVNNPKPRKHTVLTVAATWRSITRDNQDKETTKETVRVSYVSSDKAQKESDLVVEEQVALYNSTVDMDLATKRADNGNFDQAKAFLDKDLNIWNDLKKRGSVLADKMLAVNNQNRSMLDRGSYTREVGTMLRTSNIGARRSRSVGKIGFASLYASEAVSKNVSAIIDDGSSDPDFDSESLTTHTTSDTVKTTSFAKRRK